MFESAELKITRGQEHLTALEKACSAFIDRNKPRWRFDPHEGTIRFQVELSETLPDEISLILGDAVHNLYSALDHLTWEIMGLDKATQDRHTKFITGSNQINYDASCNGLVGARTDTKSFLRGLEVFLGGKGDRLYKLRDLDIADKHHILTPMFTVAKTPAITVTFVAGGYMQIGENSVVFDKQGQINFMQVGAPIKNIKQDSEGRCEIVFRDGGFRENPIVPTLMQLADDVINVRKAFCDFIAARPS